MEENEYFDLTQLDGPLTADAILRTLQHRFDHNLLQVSASMVPPRGFPHSSLPPFLPVLVLDRISVIEYDWYSHVTNSGTQCAEDNLSGT